MAYAVAYECFAITLSRRKGKKISIVEAPRLLISIHDILVERQAQKFMSLEVKKAY